jgi:hypothetical protein
MKTHQWCNVCNKVTEHKKLSGPFAPPGRSYCNTCKVLVREADSTLSKEELEKLFNGPLRGPSPQFTILRLVLAIGAMLEATGEAGKQALLDYCANRQQRDEENAR